MSEPLEFTPGLYRHHKGGLYTAIGLVRHHDTGLPMVVYVSHAKGHVSVRPLNGWPGDPDGWLDPVADRARDCWVPRFELVSGTQELDLQEPDQAESGPRRQLWVQCQHCRARAPHPGAIAHSFDCPALARDVGDGAK